MTDRTCNSMEDEPGPIQWRCSRRIGHDLPHAFEQFGTTYHEWTDE